MTGFCYPMDRSPCVGVTMIVEASREPEHFWHVWPMPKGLQRDDAIVYFKMKVKPRDYLFERFVYDHVRGFARTL